MSFGSGVLFGKRKKRLFEMKGKKMIENLKDSI